MTPNITPTPAVAALLKRIENGYPVSLGEVEDVVEGDEDLKRAFHDLVEETRAGVDHTVGDVAAKTGLPPGLVVGCVRAVCAQNSRRGQRLGRDARGQHGHRLGSRARW